MNELRPENISVIDPISPAIDRVKLMLFQPFDLTRWLVIGFCAFLANLGKGGGGGGGGRGGGYRGGGYHAHETLNQAKVYFQHNFSWIVPLTVFIVLLVICIWLAILYFSSRGRFMFLHCVAENKAEVKTPWTKFREHANNLFVFRIVLGLIGIAAVILPIFMILFFVLASPVIISVFSSVMASILIIGFIITLALIAKFTQDFVVPIMYLRTTSCIAAWREFLTILSVNKARFALYVLFQIAIGMVIGIIIVIGMCFGTCCLCGLGLLLLIPYVGTVISLPLPVFMRSYSLYYLQQFGPQYDVFRPEISEPVIQGS